MSVPGSANLVAIVSRRAMVRFLAWCLLLATSSVSFAQQQLINVSTAGELRDAIIEANQNPEVGYVISVQSSILLDEFDGLGSALPPVAGDVTILNGTVDETARLAGGGSTSDFRLIEVANGGSLKIFSLEMTDFSSSANGGCIAVNDGGELILVSATLSRCMSGGDGGAIYAGMARIELNDSMLSFNTASRGGAIALMGNEPFGTSGTFFRNSAMDGGAIFSTGFVEVRGAMFTENHATVRGGAVSFGGRTLVFSSVFDNNTANVAGCDVNVRATSPDSLVTMQGNHLDGDSCATQRVENPLGPLRAMHNTVYGPPQLRLFNSTGDIDFLGNMLASGSSGYFPNASAATKTLCADFGSGAFQSLGSNVATDDTCFLTHPNDLITSTPGLLAPDVDGIRGIAASSPALDRGPFGLVFLPSSTGVDPVLPCGYRDIRGLGRPQDGDGDGVFRCDSGAFEVQGGPDIGDAQTAAYYDSSRSGEGVFVDMIGNGLATVSVFSFGPLGGMAWFTGLGTVVGNSVVVDNLDLTIGGRFGAAFDADAITRERVGGLSLVFPNCGAGSQPGRMTFDPSLDTEFEPLSVQAQRLTRVVPCSGAPGPFAGLSGGWYSQARSGEGLFLQFQPDGSVVVVFYSFTPQGELFWAIAGEATFDGTTLVATMLYPAGTTRFGSNFNASEVDLQPWGTVTMRFTGCDAADFSWNSTVPGYGSGGFPYVRLTQPSGTSCPF